jgi:tetratricopeptide (TPR) repeat protein
MFSMSFLMYALVIAVGTATFAGVADESEAKKIAQPARAEAPPARNIPWIGLGALQLLAVLMVWQTTIQPVRASVLSIESNNAFSGGDYLGAFNDAKLAASIWTPYMDEQTFLQSRNFISLVGTGTVQKLAYWREWHDLIMKISELQIADHPNNANPIYINARTAEALATIVPEDSAIAEKEYRRAIELSPKRQQLYFGFARFLAARGRLDETGDYLKQVVSFDDELGESHWQYGLYLFFDKKALPEGAAELTKAVSVKYPYVLQDAREALALSYAYEFLGNTEALKGILTLLPKLPQSDVNVYLQIATVMERNGLMEERNMILNALVRMDPNLAQQLQPLINGSATSIQASIEAASIVPLTLTNTTTQVVTTSPAGLRVK